MAKFSFEIPDSLTRQLDRLGMIDDVAPKMINAATPIVKDEIVRRSGSHKRTGAMSGSIKPTEPKRKGSGHSAVVRPTGRDGKGVRNMEKMAYLEYGTSHQPSTPVITPAIEATEDQVIDTMTEVFEEELWIKKWGE